MRFNSTPPDGRERDDETGTKTRDRGFSVRTRETAAARPSKHFRVARRPGECCCSYIMRVLDYSQPNRNTTTVGRYNNTHSFTPPRGGNRRQTERSRTRRCRGAAAWMFAWVDPVTRRDGRSPGTPVRGHGTAYAHTAPRRNRPTRPMRRSRVGGSGVVRGGGDAKWVTVSRGGRSGSRVRPRADGGAPEPDHWVTRQRCAGVWRPGRFRDRAMRAQRSSSQLSIPSRALNDLAHTRRRQRLTLACTHARAHVLL